MIAATDTFRGVQRISRLKFLNLLVASPARRDAGIVYDYAVSRGVDACFLLAMFFHESKFGTAGWATKTKSYGNTRPPSFGAREIGAYQQDSGAFTAHPGPYAQRSLCAYINWGQGGISTVARLVEHVYRDRTQIGEVFDHPSGQVWAPSGDANDPTGYLNAVLAFMGRQQDQKVATGGETMAAIPKPPITRHIYGIPPKVDDVGVTAIVRNRRPGATVMHSIVGTLSGTDGYFDNPDTAALTDYGIGQTNHNGSGFAQIIQWCEIDGDLMPWASGPVRVPQGDGPRFLAHFGGSAAVNDVGVSIEHDDTTLPDGRVGPLAKATVSVYQWSASIWLQAWLHAEVFKQTSATYDWNMHHREFCGSAYKECPHPRIFDYTEQYQAAVKAIMDRYQKGTPYPAGGLIVAGLRINTPPESGVAPQEGQVKEPAPEKAEAYINAKGETIVVANLGGRATRVEGYAINDVGVSVVNAAGGRYDRSIQQGAFKPWLSRGK